MKLSTMLLCVAGLVSSPAVFAESSNAHHFPGVFVGATNFDGETNASFGVEYEYKIDSMWGVGALYEVTNEAHHGEGVSVSLLAGYVHPWQNLRLGLGFGKERVGGHHPVSESLVRVSASYDFHVGAYGVAPTFAIDSIDGETATVFGVAFVRGF